MAQCLLLLLLPPAPASAPASAYFVLCVLLLLLEPATETNTHIYQISMPQGLQNELHLAVALATPLAPLFPPPPALYCSCPKCLAALYSSRKSRRRKSRWRKLRRRNQRRPQCKAADKVCTPSPSLPCRRHCAGTWRKAALGWATTWLGLSSIGCN